MVDKGGFTVLDMFGGGGGLSEGFFRNNFKFIAHIEKDIFASKSLETRALYYVLKNNGQIDIYYEYLKGKIPREVLFEETKEFSKDISSGVFNIEISNKTEKPLINEIKDRMQKYGIQKIDVMIGGPPCQAYSVVGRSRDPDKMKNDGRKFMYPQLIKELKPYAA